MKHPLRKFFPHLSPFLCTSTWALFVARTVTVRHSNSLKAFPHIWGLIPSIESTTPFSNLANEWLVCGTSKVKWIHANYIRWYCRSYNGQQVSWVNFWQFCCHVEGGESLRKTTFWVAISYGEKSTLQARSVSQQKYLNGVHSFSDILYVIWGCELDSPGSEVGTLASFCEQGKETSDSIKNCKILDQLNE